MHSLRLCWIHWDSLGPIWPDLDPLGFTWTSLDSLADSFGLTWTHLVSLGFKWRFTLTQLVSPVLTWTHLDSLGFSWIQSEILCSKGTAVITSQDCVWSLFSELWCPAVLRCDRGRALTVQDFVRNRIKNTVMRVHILIILGYGETRFLLRPSGGNDHN